MGNIISVAIEHGITALKMSAIIAISGVFLIAIWTIINLITSILFANVIGEVLGIISMCLPFDALAVFGAIGLAITSILAFMIAKKIFELSGWVISTI